MHDGGLNPIFEFAAKGHGFEKNGRWRQAIQWYQKALACLPNLFDTKVPIEQPPWACQNPLIFRKPHAARLYAALARCLMRAGRIQDCLLACMAAHRLDPSNALAARMLAAAQTTQKSAAETVVRGEEQGVCLDDEIEIKDFITLIVTTHCTDRLKRFQALSPPSTKLLTATYGSLLNVFGEKLSQCPKLLCYDQHADTSAREMQYLKALESFSLRNGFNLRLFENAGLFAILENSVQVVDTPYLFFVEHDWLFRGKPVWLNAIINEMNQDANLHSVRFNKRENQLDGHDFIMEVDTQKRSCPILHTASHSNNPSVIRTRKMRDEWLPLCRQALNGILADLGASAFGIEEILFKRHAADIRTSGFPDAHKSWGTSVYGRVGDPPRIMHIGE